jgi:hypothetical protein
MLQINTYNDLTNEFILEISDELFTTTTAYTIFIHKQLFVNKIHDKQIRYKMLQNILQIVPI